MQLNQLGEWVRSTWMNLPCHFQSMELDEFVVMPNHVHGIIWLGGANCRGEALGRNRDQLGRSCKILNPFRPVKSIVCIKHRAEPFGNAITMNISFAAIAPYTTSDSTCKTIHCPGTNTWCIHITHPKGKFTPGYSTIPHK
jgi:hypothetical protein